jgi:hypothetical protein
VWADAADKALARRGAALRKRWDVIALAGIVLLGGWLRCSRLDLMEFKDDEWRLHSLAVEQASGRMQLTGMMSSVGVHNPPMPVYLFSIPALFTKDPVACAWLAALLNTAAIAGTYVLARMWASRLASLAAAFLFAVSPSAVLMSRKVWAQDLLPFVVVCFFILGVLWLRNGRWWQVVAAGAALSIANQIHYSTLALWPLVIVGLWRGRSRAKAWQLAAAGVAFLALWTPFLVALSRGATEEAASYRKLPLDARGAVGNAIDGAVWEARLMGTGAFDVALGSSRVEAGDGERRLGWLNALFGVGLAAGCVVVLLRLREKPDIWVLLLWLALPPMALWFRVAYSHYFVLSYPAGFIVVGVLGDWAVERLRGRLSRLAVPCAALALAAVAVVGWSEVRYFRSFLDYVDAHGGTSGDYGISYRDKVEVADYLANEIPGGYFALKDVSVPVHSEDTYGYLYRMRGGRGVQVPAGALDGNVAFTTYVIAAPGVGWGRLREDGPAGRAERAEVGHMLVAVMRPQAGAQVENGR